MTDRLAEARKRIEEQRAAKQDIDPLVAFGQLSEDLPPEKRYINRDKIPEHLVHYSDWYYQKTGQEPTNDVLTDWIAEFDRWNGKAIETAHLDKAAAQFEIVWRPGTLTNTAIALKAQSRQQVHSVPIFRAEEQTEKKFVPMPDNVREQHRQRMEALRQKQALEAKQANRASAHDPQAIKDVLRGMQNG